MIKKIFKFITILFITFLISPPIVTFAHDAYFWTLTIDDTGYNIISYVDFDENNVGNHKEEKLGNFSSLTDWKKAIMPDNKADSYKDFKDNPNDEKLPYTFPTFHTKSIIVKDAQNNATSIDMNRAYAIADTLTSNLNNAINDVVSTSGKPISNVDDYLGVLKDVVNGAMNSQVSGGTQTISRNGHKFQIIKGNKTNTPKQHPVLTNEDYVTIEGGGLRKSYVCTFPKGYQSYQELYKEHTDWSKDIRDKIAKNDAVYLTWGHIGIQATYNKLVKNYTYSNLAEIVKPSKIEQIFSDFLSSILNQLRSLLGLYEIPDLVFNVGAKANSYYKGMMPNTWYENAKIFHMICEGIAFMLLIGAMAKLLVQRNIASINPVVRVNLIDGIKNLMITGAGLLMTMPLFAMVGTLNMQIVSIFASSSPFASKALSLSTAPNQGKMIGGVIISIAYGIIMLYFNYVYIVRGIMITILFATAPLYIVSIAFGGKYKALFSTWLRELLANIFLQTFHAIILSFFAITGSL